MYSKKWVNAVSFILTTVIFLAINIILNNIDFNRVANLETKEDISENYKENNVNEENVIEEVNTIWTIEIPEISLIANISEGTDEETLNKYVGHFSITPKKEGNIGLAAHNRGYPVNYFEKLTELEGGEEIIYTYGQNIKTYVVIQNIKISDIDWSYLENTMENKLTLITCIANEPAYRRCVQAIEKEDI